ncbi:MAG: DUF5399 family protein [Chlamydiota bacterium]
MKRITIDQLDIKEHIRWAVDQETYDASYVNESTQVALHPEIISSSHIYPSKLEELFELQKRNMPWASFAPPHNFFLFSKRFFSYRLFLDIHCEDKSEESSDEENNEEPSEEEQLLHHNLMTQVKHQSKFEGQSSVHFEKDKSTLINLFESIEWVNGLLKQISARKLQYQKG